MVNDALLMAIWERKPDKGLLWHTDWGSRYASGGHRELLEQRGIEQSMGRKGNCWEWLPLGDHAVPESFFHALKTELIHRQTFHSREEAKQAVLNISECPLTGSGYIPLMDISPPLTSSCNKMPLNLVPGKASTHQISVFYFLNED